MLYIEAMEIDALDELQLESELKTEIIQFNTACKYADLELEANLALSEHKLIMESGSMDDATLLFSEAVKENTDKKKGYIRTMLEKFSAWLNSMVVKFKAKFAGKQQVPEKPFIAIKNKVGDIHRKLTLLLTKSLTGQDVSKELEELKQYQLAALNIRNFVTGAVLVKGAGAIRDDIANSKYIQSTIDMFTSIIGKLKSALDKNNDEEKTSVLSKIVNFAMDTSSKALKLFNDVMSRFTKKEVPSDDETKAKGDDKKDNKKESSEADDKDLKEVPDDDSTNESALDTIFEAAMELGLLDDNGEAKVASIFDI